MRVTVSYFPPFDATRINASESAANTLVELRRVALKKLSNSFAEMPVEVARTLGNTDLLLMLGQDSGASGLLFEQLAINWVDTGERPDAMGWSSSGERILDDVPMAIMSRLNARALVERLRHREHAAYVSYAPGTHLCNFAYFHALVMSRHADDCLVIFVHVPASLKQVSKNGDRRQSAMSSNTVAAALSDLIDLVNESPSAFAIAA